MMKPFRLPQSNISKINSKRHKLLKCKKATCASQLNKNKKKKTK